MTSSELRSARVAAGLTQKELANLVGLDAITISRWERGVQEPHPMFARAVVKALSKLGSVTLTAHSRKKKSTAA